MYWDEKRILKMRGCCIFLNYGFIKGVAREGEIFISQKQKLQKREVENIEEAGCMKDIISVIQPALLYFYVCLI